VLTLADFSLGDLVIALFFLFGMALYVALVILVFSDVIVSRDLTGWAKAGWLLLVLVFPFLGVLVYLIVRGDDMPLRWFGRGGPFSRSGPLTPA
jgi:hypothetical protein